MGGDAGPKATTYEYKDTTGGVVGGDTRRDADGKKAFKQFSIGADGELIPRAMPAPRPIFHLDELIARPGAPVLIVEGEKTCCAAAGLFPDFVVMTSAGGSNAAHKTDWSPLQGCDVVIWPDHDDAGAGYAKAVLEHVPHARVVSVPPSWPAHWDLADPAPADADLAEMLANAGNGAAAEAIPLPRTTGISGNGKGPLSPNKKRQKTANRALADKYCNADGSPLTADQIKARIADLDKIAYDRERRAIAEAAGVRAGTVDALRAEVIVDSVGVAPDTIEPWPEPVDGDDMLDQIVALAHRYLVLPEGGAEPVAWWTVLTHAHDCFNFSPILTLLSPSPECGKSTVFTLLAWCSNRCRAAT